MQGRQVVARGVSVAGVHEPFVTGLELVAEPGEVTIVPVDPGAAQQAVALALGGRMELLTGEVTVGGQRDPRLRQGIVRLVDVEDVTAPEEGLPVHAVIAEELALAGRPFSRRDVRDVLERKKIASRARDRWASVPAEVRTVLLLELAARAPEVRVVVLAGPDRHGGDPGVWLAAARRVAAGGQTVIVLCTVSTLHHLFGAADRPARVPATPTLDDSDRGDVPA